MKDLIIPTKKTDSIDISEITDDFDGIIIVYKDTNAIGYIQYVSGDWNYYDCSVIHIGNRKNGKDLFSCEYIQQTGNGKYTAGKGIEFL